MSEKLNQLIKLTRKRHRNRELLIVVAAVLTLPSTVIEPAHYFYNLFMSQQDNISAVTPMQMLFIVLSTGINLFAAAFIMRGLLGYTAELDKPTGRVFDWLIPPQDAENMALEMLIGFERWETMYSPLKCRALYALHSINSVWWYYVGRWRGKSSR